MAPADDATRRHARDVQRRRDAAQDSRELLTAVRALLARSEQRCRESRAVLESSRATTYSYTRRAGPG